VRRAAREELRLGATQLKLFASGGVVFPAKSHAARYEFFFDPNQHDTAAKTFSFPVYADGGRTIPARAAAGGH